MSWNPLEYQAYEQDFHTRGRRLEEQIVVLRRFWTERYVTFRGEFHDLDGVGLNRLPDHLIPIWIGGGDVAGASDRLLRRVVRLGDGWMPLIPNSALPEAVRRLRVCLENEGRSANSVKVRANLTASRTPVRREIGGVTFTSQGGPDAWIADAKALIDASVDEITTRRGRHSPSVRRKWRSARWWTAWRRCVVWWCGNLVRECRDQRLIVPFLEVREFTDI